MKENLGDHNSLKLAGYCDDIGLLYMSKGDYKLALQYLLKGLKIKETVLGVEHIQTDISYT